MSTEVETVQKYLRGENPDLVYCPSEPQSAGYDYFRQCVYNLLYLTMTAHFPRQSKWVDEPYFSISEDWVRPEYVEQFNLEELQPLGYSFSGSDSFVLTSTKKA